MKWLIRIGLGLVILGVGTAVLLPMLISTDGLVERAETEASRTLGRDVAIGGVSGISVLPPRLTLDGLSIASGDGFEAEHLVEVEKAQLAVRLMPLLSSRVEIETFVLTEPRIVLETKADGSNNFTFAADDSANQPSDASGLASVEAAPVTGKLEVRGGSVLWIAPDARYAAENADLTLVLPPLGSPLTLDGTLSIEGIPSSVSLEVDEPWAMTAAKSSPLRFDLRLGKNSVAGSFDALAEPLTIRGPMSIDVKSLADLTPLIGQELVDAAAPFGAMELEGTAEATAERVALSGLRFVTAIASGGGGLALNMAGPKPALTGEVSIGEADLRSFFPEGEQAPPSEDASFPAWSETAMDFSGLSAANVQVDLSAERIVLPTYEITGVAARAGVSDGRAELALTSGRAFGGGAMGLFVLNARQATPRIDAKMVFDGIDFAEAAPALFSTQRLIGRGSLAFDLATRGASEAAWVKGLGGTASAEIEEGSIAGVSLSTIAVTGIALVQQLNEGAETLPTVQSALGTLVRDAVSPDASTTFDVADFGLTITNGEVKIGEAKLLSDTFRATLGGGVNLPGQAVDLSLRLSAKAPEATGYREFRLPVAVSGTFSEPKISLDTAPLAEELARGAAGKALGRAGINVQEGQTPKDALRERAASEAKSLLGGLTSRRRPREPEPSEDESTDEDDGGAEKDPPL